ncbi:hypothetical protein HDU67_002665 [Dinochytrium kinnereticum]|nr:hypothetical protein HDU67_002665 [Dinochytrium kinnereticum]
MEDTKPKHCDVSVAETPCICRSGPSHVYRVTGSERRTRVVYAGLLIVGLMACLGLKFHGLSDGLKKEGMLSHTGTSRGEKGDDSPFKWEPCTGRDPSFEFDCGTLMVPLNHLDKNDTRLIPIGVVRYRAQQQPSLGSILFNPGGPGGSGVALVKGAGPMLARLTGSRHDVIGFDPRGIGSSSPVICHARAAEHVAYDRDSARFNAPGSLGSKTSLKEFAARRNVYAAGCRKHSGEFSNYISTAFTARDMDLIRESLGEELMNYWGFSYGTFLGITYANMFPDRVGRYIIDGVTDPTTFAGNFLDWSRGSLLHADAVLDAFGHECELAGGDRCPLATLANSTAFRTKYNLIASSTTPAVTALLKAFLHELAEAPLPAPNAVVPDVLTASFAGSILFQATYSPMGWPVVADVFAQVLESGDPAPLLDMVMSSDDSTLFCPLTDDSGSNGFPAVKCNDGDGDDVLSLEAWEETAKEVGEISTLAGREWTYMGLIVIIGNTLDPVTPIESARKVSKFLGPESSVLITQEGLGHCSLNHPSLCTLSHIEKLFLTGEAPDEGVRCVSDYVLFPPTGVLGGDGFTGNMGRKFRDAHAVAKEIHRAFKGSLGL